MPLTKDSARTYLTVAAMIFAFPAAADWQYTKWGMTPNQLTSSVPGGVHTNDDRSRDATPMIARLYSDYSGGGMDFIAYFYFDGSDRLARVSLEPKDMGKCSDLRFELSNAYGQPHDTSISAVTDLAKWWSEETGNIVVFLQIGSGCAVTYSALKEAGEVGGL